MNTPRWQGLWLSDNELFAEAPTRYGNGGLLYHLCCHNDYKKEIKEIFNDEALRSLDSLVQSRFIDSLYVLLRDEAERDNELYPMNRQSRTFKDAVNGVRDFFNKRVEFFEWLYSAKDDEVVRVSCITEQPLPFLVFERMVTFYGSTETGIRLPSFEYHIAKTIDAKSPKWYFAGTNRYVPKRYRFKESQQVELRWEKPTIREKILRRIKRIFKF